MTIETFLADMEGYYGDKYGPAGSKIMGQYLGKIDPDLVPYLYAEALKNVDRRFHAAPGVAELERVKGKARDELKAAQARARALAPPERLQIGEDILAPESVADILGRLAGAKKLDNPGQ